MTAPSTFLFVPGDRPERFQKASQSGAGMVVFDLEDAVGVGNKSAARDHVAAALAQAGMRACVRINGSESEWFSDDCRLLDLPGVAAVMLPKAEEVAPVLALQAAAGRSLPVIPIVESARGLEGAKELALAAGVQRLAFGSVDFQLDLGIEGGDEELLYARSRLVLVSRLAERAAPIDGVTLAVADAERLQEDTLRARRLGFGAKLCIHPVQVATVKRCFLPDEQLVSWAKGVLEAAAATPHGAIVFEGKLIDKPVVEHARTILGRTDEGPAR
ncbi:CoA ester lyase [Luteimonas sp. BDR2-5]|uniref:HpcH/HpaI aldolase/citrate lyase family protein n=1 Tax=Proluteimonas luteida TaxID=2878685 RepID=UPI001E30325E|nr:CoA ester lyase [Luteimonas sp. BDR2-5]MCD9029727.1 CoA ester lyase [Luteimonas sp. BDR2-5]